MNIGLDSRSAFMGQRNDLIMRDLQVTIFDRARDFAREV